MDMKNTFSTTATLSDTASREARARSGDETGKADGFHLKMSELFVYGLLGMLFGIVLMKSEVISWFRIQEMFLFDSFHMYGVIGSAIGVGAISLQLIKRFDIRTLEGEPIRVAPKEWGTGRRYWMGGTLFGLGWALLGACPGPLFALLGGGVTVMVMALLGALAGTWVYGYFRERLPH